MQTIQESQVHPFELAGLGKAPFRCIGLDHRVGPIKTESNGVTFETGAPGQPMGSCDYCGTGIAYCYVILSSDKQRFIVGCDCVRKTADVALRSEVNAQAKARRAQVRDERRTLERAERQARQVETAKAKRDAFLAENPGLADALATDNPILREMVAGLAQYGSLSAKQVAFAFRLASEAMAPKWVEVPIAVPTGKATFAGVVLMAKGYEGAYGVAYKMLVRIYGEGGCWKAFGTIPESMFRAGVDADGRERFRTLDDMRGLSVEVTATVEPGRDFGFAKFKRPKVRVLEAAQ